MLAPDTGIQKAVLSWVVTVIFSNEKRNDIMKIVELLKDIFILWKGVRWNKSTFLAFLLSTLGNTLLGSTLSEITGKVITRIADGIFQACW